MKISKKGQKNMLPTLKEQKKMMEVYQAKYVKALLDLNNSGVSISRYTMFDARELSNATKECLMCFKLPDSEAKQVLVGINCILIAMNPIEADMIYYDFLFKKNPDWWRYCFSKSSYYRIRKNAMYHFLKLAGEF